MASYAKEVTIPSSFVQLDGGGTISVNVTLAPGCRGIIVGTAGNISAIMQNGTVVTGMPVTAGLTSGKFATIVAGGSTALDVWAVY